MRNVLCFLVILLLPSCVEKQSKNENTEKSKLQESQKELSQLLIDTVSKSEIEKKQKEEGVKQEMQNRKFILNFDTVKNFDCNIQVLAHIDTRLYSLSPKDIAYFFRTIKSKCSNNAEFSEWSNELLLKILERHPEKALQILNDKNREIEFDYIYTELTTPIHDLIPIEKVQSSIRNLNLKTERNDSILMALNVALEKS